MSGPLLVFAPTLCESALMDDENTSFLSIERQLIRDLAAARKHPRQRTFEFVDTLRMRPLPALSSKFEPPKLQPLRLADMVEVTVTHEHRLRRRR